MADPDRSNPIEILPYLYIGNLRASRNIEKLTQAGITHILTVADSEPEFPKRFQYRVVAIDDSGEDDLSRHFYRCFDFIDAAEKAKGVVLVHCLVGISTSPAIAVGYLMHKENMSFDEALAFVKAKDSMIALNSGFISQLQTLADKIDGSASEDD